MEPEGSLPHSQAPHYLSEIRSRNSFDRTFTVATADLLEIEPHPPIRKQPFH